MKATVFRRLAFGALALVLAVSALPLAASAKQEDPFIQLVATDVTLDETEFEYTGSEIKPNVTVRVNGQLLTLDEDYNLDYANNVEVGKAKVIVTGIATSGYTGTVEHPFFIVEKENQEPEFTLIELKGTDVTIDGTQFSYTGQPIEPAVTVTAAGKTLEKGRDYAVEYVNNLIPGTGTVIVRGIATASETLGYTGEVRIDFTITPAETEAPSETQPSETQPGETTPGQTQPSETQPQETEPAGPTYKITKGNGSSWYQGSTSDLSFTADGNFADFTGVSINGKKLEEKHYSAKAGSTVVLLKNSYLKELKEGKYTITIHFEEADAEGTFHIEAEKANPKTGDSIHLVTAILFVSLTGLIGAAFAYNRKLWK